MRWPALLLMAATVGCAREPTRQYPLHGQVIAIDEVRAEGARTVTVKHDDIRGFMPAMTMPYTVREPRQLDGVQPGDIIDATLVIERTAAYLDGLRRTGHAPLPADAEPVKNMDVMQPGDEVPDVVLQDQVGAAHRLKDWRGRTLAVTFVYTRCPLPDFCPLLDRRFVDLQRAIAHDVTLRDRVHLVSVTFDPAHDTPAVIAEHARAVGADPAIWSYVTGSPDAIERMTSRFGVSAIPDRDSAETMTHNLRTAIIDPRSRLMKVYTGNSWTANDVLADLRGHGG